MHTLARVIRVVLDAPHLDRSAFVRLLVARTSDGRTCTHAACESGSADSVRLWLELLAVVQLAPAQVQEILAGRARSGASPLDPLLRKGDAGSFDLYTAALRESGVDADGHRALVLTVAEQGFTLLHLSLIHI